MTLHSYNIPIYPPHSSSDFLLINRNVHDDWNQINSTSLNFMSPHDGFCSQTEDSQLSSLILYFTNDS